MRADLQEVLARHARTLDAQRHRRSEPDMIANAPADGMVTGIGSINSELFGQLLGELSGDQAGAGNTRCAEMADDATVLAGTGSLLELRAGFGARAGVVPCRRAAAARHRHGVKIKSGR